MSNILTTYDNTVSTYRRNSLRLSTPLDQKLKEHEVDFTDYVPIKVKCITWNVNSGIPTFHIQTIFASDVLPDIVTFGIQEMDMSLDSVVLNDVKYEEEWIHVIHKTLGNRYFIVTYKRLAGIFLIVCALNTHKEVIRYISTTHAATGILGLMGNKGAVGISFDFYESSLCFICSHFAAHQEEIEKRNQNFSLINHKMRFSSTKQLYPLKIDDHDVVFWCGDLNYRISNLTLNQIMADIVESKYGLLLKNDQLISEKNNNKVFMRYNEAKINFAPTYKFIPGTNDYDITSGRLPAWCDRILWLENNNKCDIKIATYSSQSTISTSDHKPVIGLFDMKVCVIDSKRYDALVDTIRIALDAQENKMIPSIKLSTNEIDFADIHYKIPKVQPVSLVNNGSCDAHFQFLSKDLNIHSYDPEFHCPSWLTISQTFGCVPVGQSITLAFEISLTKEDVAKIDQQNPMISAILILHLVEGRDYFICVEGTYVPSCFGSSPQILSKLKYPVKSKQLNNNEKPPMHHDIVGSKLTHTYDISLVPKELVNLTNCLIIYGLKTPGVFTNIGFFDELVNIMKALDYSTIPIQAQFEKLSIHSVAESYLLFLDMLKEPLIPVEYVSPEIFTDGKINPVKFLAKLDQVRKIMLIYVLTFIGEIITNKNFNHVDPIILYTVFSNVLIRYDGLQSNDKPKVLPIKNRIKIFTSLMKFIIR